MLAYMQVKEAEGERQAAEMQYEAKLRLAEGDAQARVKRAEGERAVKMVDVNVERERVNVEQARVEVERQSLSNKQEFEDAALSLRRTLPTPPGSASRWSTRPFQRFLPIGSSRAPR